MKRIISFILAIAMIIMVMPQVYAGDMGKIGKFQTLSIDYWHSAAIKNDGTLWTWGNNMHGQLGDGTKKGKFTPVKIMDNVVSVSLGDFHSAAIKNDGTLWAWGDNTYGQVVSQGENDITIPMKVMDNVSTISLGENHSAAIKNDGTLWTWGDNSYGQLGDGTNIKRNSPVKIMDSVSIVSIGEYYNAAVKNDGTLWTWGINRFDELSDSANNTEYSPIKIMDDVSDVSVGSQHIAIIKKDGTLWTWGDNTYGQLGDGTYSDRTSPVKIMDNVISISLGTFHSAAIQRDGTLWTWGDNSDGQRGWGKNTCVPIKIMDGVSVVNVASHHSAAIKKDGTLWTWGGSSYGERGDGGIGIIYTPVKIMENVMLPISVMVNNNLVPFNQPPIIQEGRTLVPLRAIFEAMGATVDWDDNTKTVTSKLDSTTIQLTIGSNILYKNGTAVALDVPAQLINGYTMVPARAVAEAFGADVDWDGDTQTVYITTKGNTYSVNSVPQITYDGYNANFADFNGMYIDSFAHITNSNGTENVKFDVYNTQYIYGLVEIYNASGDLTDVAIIDKMSNSTSIKGVLIDDTGSLIRDIWNGTALTYRQESGYSKKTSINIDIPKGGYINITNDMSESFIASAINLSDMVFAAKSTFSTLSGFNSETSKDFVYELSAKLINETAFSEVIKTPKKFTEKLWKGVGEELYMNSESVGGFLDTVSKNLDEFADGELAELMISTATNCGIGIAEGTFEALAGPAGVALKAMFTITSVTDVLIEMNDGLDCLYQGSIKIKTT